MPATPVQSLDEALARDAAACGADVRRDVSGLTTHAKTGERRVIKFCYEASRLAALRREVTLVRLLREELGRDAITRITDWNLDHDP